MTKRRAMNWEDRAITAMKLGAGIFIGIVLMTLIALIFEGLWMSLIIALPFVLLQLLFEGVIRLVWHGGRRILGYPAAAPEAAPEPDPSTPWLRAHSMMIGSLIGAFSVVIFSDVWSFA